MAKGKHGKIFFNGQEVSGESFEFFSVDADNIETPKYEESVMPLLEQYFKVFAYLNSFLPNYERPIDVYVRTGQVIN